MHDHLGCTDGADLGALLERLAVRQSIQESGGVHVACTRGIHDGVNR